MENQRSALESGIRIRFENGNTYEIIGEPIGSGGGSIIYPAEKVYYSENNQEMRDGILYALKECYPVSMGHSFCRNEAYEIVPTEDNESECFYLNHAKSMMLYEKQVSQEIYKTGFRILPILESTDKAILIDKSGKELCIKNTYTIMEALSSKGRTLNSYIQELEHLSTVQTFHIIRQLLYALREVHNSNYLHLDIQDGNILIKGTLEDESGILTLIDFGSSRKTIDGKTEAIKDKVIFTTQGYSAPEILQRNDGTLQLSPETDIYSVGCLMLYLLTGTRYDSNALLHNTSGRYISQFKLRKIDCPKHLLDTMQGIIAHALKPDPADRFHSADEMLKEVSDFIKAITPASNNLKLVKYDAFICYKHGDIDSAAAKELQKNLEHFHAPKGVSDEKHPIKRVFLDEGELSSCADYGALIHDALKNTNWLIVICSPSAPASPWVNLEIETFLKYHDRSHILAVLTEGEPKDSFPQQLLGSTSSAEGEILAADARGNNKKEILKNLKKDALLKVASTMIGTTFDTLKQRYRAFILRRAAIIFAAALLIVLGFSGYIFYQSLQISRQYQETLVKQANLLALESADLLEKGERKDALLIALEAINNNPDSANAELALENALYCYKFYESGNYFPLDTFELNSSAVACYDYNENNQIFAISDAQGTIYFWDFANRSLLSTYQISLESQLSRNELIISLLDNQTAIIYYEDYLYCFDYVNNKLTWQNNYEESGFIPGNKCILSSDHSRFYSMGKASGSYSSSGFTLMTIDTETGELIGTANTFSSDKSPTVHSIFADSRDNYLVIYFSDSYSGDDGYQTDYSILLFDLNTNKAVLQKQLDYQGCKVLFTEDKQLAILCYDQPLLNFGLTYSGYDFELMLIDIPTGRTKWAIKDKYLNRDGYKKLQLSQYYNSETESNESVISLLVDTELINVSIDGEILSQYSYGQSIVGFCTDDSNIIYLLTYDGVIHTVLKSKALIKNEKYYISDTGIENAALGIFDNASGEIIVIPDTSQKIYIYGNVINPEITDITTDEISNFSLSENEEYYLCIANTTDLVLRRSVNDEIIFSTPIENYFKKLFGFISDYMYYYDQNTLYLYSLNESRIIGSICFDETITPAIHAYSDKNGSPNFIIKSNYTFTHIMGEELSIVETISKDQLEEMMSATSGKDISIYKSTVTFSPSSIVAIYNKSTDVSSVELELILWNIENNEMRLISGIETSYTNVDFEFSQDGELLFIPDINSSVHVFQTKTAKEIDVIVPESPRDYLSILYSADDNIVYLQTSDYVMLSYDLSNKKFISKWSTSPMKIASYEFEENSNILKVNYSESYSYMGYKFYKKTDLGEYTIYSSPSILNVSKNYLYYNNDSSSIGFQKIPILTLEEKIKKAISFLDGAEFSPLEKKYYGID